MRLLRNFFTLALWLLVLTAFVVLVVPKALGFDRYIILTGSMRPHMPPGTIIFDKPIAGKDIRLGDAITTTPPGASHLRTHRIVKIGKDPKTGAPTFTTKGDANQAIDPGRPMLITKAAIVKFHIRYLGWIFIYLAKYQTFLLFIPAGVLGIAPLVALWREEDEEDDDAEESGSPAVDLVPELYNVPREFLKGF